MQSQPKASPVHLRFITLVAVLPAFLCGVLPTAARADDEAVDKSGYNLFNPTPDNQMRAFSSDRPTKSTSATTVDAGHFQYETDLVSWSYDRYNTANTTSSGFVILDPTLKLGLTNRTDLEISLAPFNINNTHDRSADAHNAAFGFGDITTRVKVNLFGNDGGDYALAVTPFIKAPTANASIGNRHWEGGVTAPLSIALPHDWTMNIQTEYDRLERADLTNTYSNYQNLINFGHPITESLSGSLEFWSDVSSDQTSSVQYTTDLSLAWAVRDDLQLDAGVNIGLNRDAPDLQTYVGLSQRF